jgi:hypothetical protein
LCRIAGSRGKLVVVVFCAGRKEKSLLFLKKKKQKDFCFWRCVAMLDSRSVYALGQVRKRFSSVTIQGIKSFLLLFFKKEVLP